MRVLLNLVEDFEIVEALTVVDLLRRSKINVDIVSVFDEMYVKSAVNVEVKVDKKLSDINIAEYDMIVLPGGKGTNKYMQSKKLLEYIKYMYDNNKKIAAICAAPTILANIGILTDKTSTCFPSSKDELINNKVKYEDKHCIVDGNIITARAITSSMEFSLNIVEMLKGKEAREKLEKEIVLK